MLDAFLKRIIQGVVESFPIEQAKKEALLQTIMRQRKENR